MCLLFVTMPGTTGLKVPLTVLVIVEAPEEVEMSLLDDVFNGCNDVKLFQAPIPKLFMIQALRR